MAHMIGAMRRQMPNPLGRWTESCNRTVRAAPNWYVVYISRVDDCTSDRDADKAQPSLSSFQPDLVYLNVLSTREDYELTPDGWQPPIVTVEKLSGTPSELMKVCIQMTFKWVRVLKFEQEFSSVFSVFKLTSLLPNCRDVVITLDDDNVKQSAVDIECKAFGCPSIFAIKAKSVRSLTIMKSHTCKNLEPWKGFYSRPHLFTKFIFSVYENLEQLSMNVFGDNSNCETIRSHVFGRSSYPKTFHPHRVNFDSEASIITVQMREGRMFKQMSPKMFEPAQDLPIYMITNFEFMTMVYQFYKPKKWRAAEALRARLDAAQAQAAREAGGR